MANILTFTTDDKDTRNYHYEYVSIKLYDKEFNLIHGVTGNYRWQNRPWQSYEYCDALLQALDLIGASPASVEIAKSAMSFHEAMNELIEKLEILDEKTGKYVSYKN